MATLKSLSWLLRHDLDNFNHDNLHRIAISNLRDTGRVVERWWEQKYKTPLKSYGEHTMEELLVIMLEDYYIKNPEEAGKFEALMQGMGDDDWDGKMSEEYEKDIQDRLKKRRQIDLSKYQDNGTLTEEEEKKILGSLGQKLPGSKKVVNLGEGEFDEQFLGE